MGTHRTTKVSTHFYHLFWYFFKCSHIKYSHGIMATYWMWKEMAKGCEQKREPGNDEEKIEIISIVGATFVDDEFFAFVQWCK